MVRTKQTARRKSNGTPKAAPTKEPEPVKSPTQPTELSDADRAKIKSWLDKQEKPFGLATAPVSKKRKRNSGVWQTQTDLFEDRLSVQYEVRPRDKWECLRRYKKFTVGSESIAVGQYILVKHDESEDAKIDVASQWKAKVLEVRALDSEHVYIRVAWLNRPEDLPSGRKAYHGKNELIPTNQMDVIDAMAVNGSVEISYWDEKDDDSHLMTEVSSVQCFFRRQWKANRAQDQYFWRQTLDYANTKTYSELRSICIDETPQNPDEMILQCGSTECKKWQHVKCIAETAVQSAADAASKSKKTTPKKARPKNISIAAASAALAKAEKSSFTAELFIKGLPAGADQKQAEKSEIVIISLDGEQSWRDVSCLFCGKEIE
ncbi:hypothetical protein LTR37_008673 [Vermiconidia calcicola]|uniref:Uncharacterized protein n=1 Tax=Vermiconidia calcicola TaxID=1690605 RepID=A0ACC3NA40_9PEZI|nr:hypothetical protein LTR37_008673 [Vermiconidia calcicola]